MPVCGDAGGRVVDVEGCVGAGGDGEGGEDGGGGGEAGGVEGGGEGVCVDVGEEGGAVVAHVADHWVVVLVVVEDNGWYDGEEDLLRGTLLTWPVWLNSSRSVITYVPSTTTLLVMAFSVVLHWSSGRRLTLTV